VTYSVKVAKLTAEGAPCSTARTVASKVAQALLHNQRVVSKIEGFTVNVKGALHGVYSDHHRLGTERRRVGEIHRHGRRLKR